MIEFPKTLFDRLIGQPRRPALVLGAALLFAALPLIGVALEGSLDGLLINDQWRGVFIGPSVFLYIVVIAPRLSKMDVRMIHSLRSLVLSDDEQFQRLVQQALAVPLWKELAAFGLGAAWSLVSFARAGAFALSFIAVYRLIATVFVNGILLWLIYISFVSTRLASTIMRQPMQVDPLDITPFEAIGRQSLLLALVFVGGITLSLLFIIFQPGIFQVLEFWLVYVPLALVPVIVFFLNMRPVHRVLATARDQELKAVRKHILRASRALIQRLEAGGDPGGDAGGISGGISGADSASLAVQINALAGYEERLKRARTWPYNTEMLRTLVFSVLIPGGTVLGRLLVNIIYD